MEDNKSERRVYDNGAMGRRRPTSFSRGSSHCTDCAYLARIYRQRHDQKRYKRYEFKRKRYGQEELERIAELRQLGYGIYAISTKLEKEYGYKRNVSYLRKMCKKMGL